MSFEYTIYGDVRFELSYSDVELGDKVKGYILSQKSEGSFTYLSLCRFIIESARDEEQLIGAKSGIYYESPQLKPAEYTRISKILWDFILSRAIFVDFYNNEYVSHTPHDTSFGINQEATL